MTLPIVLLLIIVLLIIVFPYSPVMSSVHHRSYCTMSTVYCSPLWIHRNSTRLDAELVQRDFRAVEVEDLKYFYSFEMNSVFYLLFIEFY